MPQILPIEELRTALSATYSRSVLNQSRVLRQANIDSFKCINRVGLKYSELEHRILLYTTLYGEKIYIQMPGKESVNTVQMPLDFRPKLESANGIIMQDASFGLIWDILDGIGRQHREHLSLVASIFFRMGYMYDYKQTKACYECSALSLEGEIVREIRQAEPVELCWYHIDLSDDIWYSMNNYLGEVVVSDGFRISFEAFIKFVDMLVQNEDCKFNYKSIDLQEEPDYKLRIGRTTTCDANLLILFYLKGSYKISSLLNGFQKARGVPTINKEDYPKVTDGLVSNI